MMSHAFWQQDGRGRRFDDVAATPPSSMWGKSGGKLKNTSKQFPKIAVRVAAMEFQENEGKEGKAADELRVGTGTGGYRSWRVVNKPKEVGNLFVYCSASEEPGAGYNPGAAEVMHHGVAHGEGRVQPAHLGIRCSPAFGGCGGEGIMIEDGRGLEEIIRTRGDLEDALRSRYVRPKISGSYS